MIWPELMPSRQTGAVMNSFFLLMAMHGEAFKKAQSEIDQKIGNDRLLDFDDKESLPFLDCVLKEVFRYLNIVGFSSIG